MDKSKIPLWNLYNSEENTPETLIFMHVPKTGGISVSRAIIRHFPEEQVFHIRDPSHKRAPYFSTSFGCIDEFKSLSANQRQQYRCILGHMHFGVHEYLPGPSTYVTLFRDPVDRIISQFGQYSRMMQNGELKGEKELHTFEEFRQAKPRAVDNHQARFLCGWEFDDHSLDENLERAKQNLQEHFCVVGVLERFEESMRVLQNCFDWPHIDCLRENVGTSKLRREDIAPEMIASIQEMNWLDRELHELANSLLNASLKKCKKKELLSKVQNIFGLRRPAA